MIMKNTLNLHGGGGGVEKDLFGGLSKERKILKYH